MLLSLLLLLLPLLCWFIIFLLIIITLGDIILLVSHFAEIHNVKDDYLRLDRGCIRVYEKKGVELLLRGKNDTRRR